VFYIFHGDDDLGRGEELASLRERLAGGDLAIGDLNTTSFQGEGLTLGELRHACDTIPFLSDRRLVIVYGLLTHLGPRQRSRRSGPTAEATPAAKREFRDQLVSYLPHLPSTTRLVFVENEILPGSHPVLQLALAEHEAGRAHIRLYERPREWELPAWIRERAEAKGGSLSNGAVEMLASLIADDLRSLDLEIEKLLLYADGRQVVSDDVNALVSRAREADIFDLVDCVGRRQTDRALTLLHRMLDDRQAPLYLLAMLARQIRILIQVTELQEQGFTQREVARRLKLHPYVVEKGLAQARNFDLTQLERAHEQLVQADWSIKTGEGRDVLVLDMLLVALTHI
jgi:DNA polymerase-3 subunit delta